MESSLLIDKYLPEFQFHKAHRVTVNAPPEKVYAAARGLLTREMPMPVKCMLMMRMIPARLAGNRETPIDDGRPFLDQMCRSGFILLEEDKPREIVFGTIGQFWKLSPVMLTVENPPAFMEFNKPEFAKVAANLAVLSENGGVALFTETRIEVPDEAARRTFARYWKLISLGSGWIRVMWLNAIKKKAERA